MLLWGPAEARCIWWVKTASIWTYTPRTWSKEIAMISRWTLWYDLKFLCLILLLPGSQVQPYAGNRQASVSLPLRPVIVFLTGQEFQGQFDSEWGEITFQYVEGAGDLGGARLMREELVVVTLEYRFSLSSDYSDALWMLISGLASSGFSQTRPSICQEIWVSLMLA